MRRALVPWLPFVAVLGLSACTCNKGPPPMQTLKNEGEACMSDDTCVTGLCDGVPGTQAVCVRKCATGCNEGEVCTQLTAGRFACQPDQRRLCQACNIDTDCPYPSDKCVVVNGEHVCGRDCAFDQNCPTGYQCVNARGVDGEAKVQQCTPINASCACLARDDFQQPCQVTNEFGTCTGIKQCDLVANVVACDAPTPAAETCNGADDDCDGTVDEDQPATSCGVGACERLVSSCSDGGVAMCMPGTPATETCNGVDDDCDGTVDNGFDTGNDVANCGLCGHACALPHATPACTGSQCVVQSCDMGFDNCDGQDPNGCEVELATDPMHCGSCGRACGQQNATASCVMGDCRYTCNAGFIDLNMDPSDGCEYQCTPTSTTDLPDLAFVDANCDGIDGEVTNGVFVAPAPQGDDGNPGTRAQPKATVGAAILAAATTGKRDVYVAAGTYAGPVELNLSSNFNVAGGYSPSTWQRASTNVVTVQGGNPSLKVEGAVNVLVQAMRFEGADGTASSDVTAIGGWVKDSTGVRLESVVLTAGNGATGATGTAGTPGTPGGQGGGGTAGCVWDTRSGNLPLACQLGITVEVCNNGARPPGGGGGTSGCGYPGGGGGQPSHQDSTDKNANVVAVGSNGSPAPNGTGAAGQGVAFMVTPNGLPWFGGDGASGSNGSNGAAASAGVLSANGWAPGHGGDGTAGTHGRGGGGGGGGAGGWVPILGDFGNPCQGWGSSGGGGGGGGCGGGGGQGGRGGGAAIGLFVSASTVTGQGVVVNAGNGGNGGAGGAIGTAGGGGPAGVSPVPNDSSQGTRGGNGGAGGAGGAGGRGGGGAGGSVYGVARSASSTVTGVTVGTIGNAGTGGAAPSAGPAGARSLQVTF